MIDLTDMIRKLSESRPIFNSEADFQHALAWEIQTQIPNCMIRLEYKPQHISQRFYVDIWCSQEDCTTAIELKYKTRRLYTNVKGETFLLLSQSAQDIGRYDFLNDIQRLEEIVLRSRNIVGYAILLTNDSAYWRYPRENHTVDADFRIHQDKVITGNLSWGSNASAGTKRGREETIQIKNTYNLTWSDYSEPSLESYGKFRYLLVKVESGQGK